MPRKPENITVNYDNETTEYPVIAEGQNITFTCSGDVGRPPGTYLWQRISNNAVYNYSKIKTDHKNINGSCSYYGTSILTVTMTADENQARIRCVEISQMKNEDKFQETDPIEVFCKILN